MKCILGEPTSAAKIRVLVLAMSKPLVKYHQYLMVVLFIMSDKKCYKVYEIIDQEFIQKASGTLKSIGFLEA